MDKKLLIKTFVNNFKFWLSRKINYPLTAPDVVQVNFSFKCNLSCKMCSMQERMELFKKEGRQIEIDSRVFKKIIKETRDLGVKTILFIGGEPLLRQDLFDLTGYAKSLNLNTCVITNGVLLDKDNIEKCILSGVDWLSISIDAAKEETFSKIRNKNVLKKIIDNIEVLNRIKKEKNSDFPKVNVVCTIMDSNLEELLELVRLCKSIKVDKIMFQPVVASNIDQTQRDTSSIKLIPSERLPVLDKAVEGLIDFKKESPEQFDFIVNDFRYLNLVKDYFRNKLKPKAMPCYAGFNRLQVVQEGKVYFCVPQNKYDAVFGDISKDNLKDLWFSLEARKRRKLIKKCKDHCLQWCSYRDAIVDVVSIYQKFICFNLNRK